MGRSGVSTTTCMYIRGSFHMWMKSTLYKTFFFTIDCFPFITMFGFTTSFKNQDQKALQSCSCSSSSVFTSAREEDLEAVIATLRVELKQKDKGKTCFSLRWRNSSRRCIECEKLVKQVGKLHDTLKREEKFRDWLMNMMWMMQSSPYMDKEPKLLWITRRDPLQCLVCCTIWRLEQDIDTCCSSEPVQVSSLNVM